MRVRKVTALFLLTIALLIQTDAHDVYDYDIALEDDDNRYQIDLNRPAEIIGPHAYLQNEEEEPTSKDGTIANWTFPQNPIMDTMMQSLGATYQSSSKDLFACLRDNYPLPKGYSKPLDEYDYVIIGAGSAGSVLASRLTEDKPEAMVLLIEAGQPESLLTDVPMLCGLWSLSDYAWHYQMERTPGVCLGCEDQRCYWPRGKAVGGSSVINFMMYTRGRPEDWDRIAEDGNYGWSYDDVLHYFLKSEKANLERLPKDPPFHNHDGELAVENVPFRTGLMEAFLAAGRRMGIPTVDYNAPDGFGFGYVQTTTGGGHRASSAKAFLHPHKRRPNLHILTGTMATKVIIDHNTKRAYAVEYIRNGKKYTVRSRREVIVSAGPIASPQLLMLSGVGPKDHLKSLGIPVIQDLPVGRTLYDHLAFPGVVFRLSTTNASLHLSKIATVQNLIKWAHYGEGLLSSIGSVEGVGYIKTSQSDDPGLIPDIELIPLAGSIALDSGVILRRAWKITDETYNTGFSSLNGIDTWSAIVLLLQPRSRGYIELRDRNPFSHPKLYGNYLSDPRDLATMREAIRFVIKLGESKPFRKYGAQLHLAEYSQCRNEVPFSDGYWDCAIRTLAVTFHHQMSTCRMGPPNDPYAVVDPELRVYGIKGLRVLDSSVIPRSISAHTNAPAMMIGEKAADMIKHTWSKTRHYKEYL